jgi:hypothetical protein
MHWLAIVHGHPCASLQAALCAQLCPLFVQLVEVLALEPVDILDEQRAHALRVLLGLLKTQEHKADATQAGLAPTLTRLVRESDSEEVKRLSCDCLASIAQLRGGRQAVVEASGVEVLTTALTSVPVAAAAALCVSSLVAIRAFHGMGFSHISQSFLDICCITRRPSVAQQTAWHTWQLPMTV